jgi:hypothetical protein
MGPTMTCGVEFRGGGVAFMFRDNRSIVGPLTPSSGF